jgi:hypothetical protein
MTLFILTSSRQPTCPVAADSNIVSSACAMHSESLAMTVSPVAATGTSGLATEMHVWMLPCVAG